MQWTIVRRGTKDDRITNMLFETDHAAFNHLEQMGPAFASALQVVPNTDDPILFRMITEGLTAGDLRRIILPQVSVDEYVPGDPDTDNVVIAFFIKGVPEAVIPFRDFVMKCRGVMDVAYGESDTIPDTSIVYVEMSRTKFKFQDLYDIMDQVGILANLEIGDFSVVFPNSTKRYPYSPEVIQTYFENRSAEKNRQAQQAAIDAADDEQESAGADQEDSDRIRDEEITRDEMEEAMIEHLVESFGRF